MKYPRKRAVMKELPRKVKRGVVAGIRGAGMKSAGIENLPSHEKFGKPFEILAGEGLGQRVGSLVFGVNFLYDT